ncbi:hypothetical protein K438DRAFT_1250399 [Mycena galopus ATCC 62051]|nr:hypothetical protein K438DRAFT_1250399 [Mycena galopus ATCC 62051]
MSSPMRPTCSCRHSGRFEFGLRHVCKGGILASPYIPFLRNLGLTGGYWCLPRLRPRALIWRSFGRLGMLRILKSWLLPPLSFLSSRPIEGDRVYPRRAHMLRCSECRAPSRSSFFLVCLLLYSFSLRCSPTLRTDQFFVSSRLFLETRPARRGGLFYTQDAGRRWAWARYRSRPRSLVRGFIDSSSYPFLAFFRRVVALPSHLPFSRVAFLLFCSCMSSLRCVLLLTSFGRIRIETRTGGIFAFSYAFSFDNSAWTRRRPDKMLLSITAS